MKKDKKSIHHSDRLDHLALPKSRPNTNSFAIICYRAAVMLISKKLWMSLLGSKRQMSRFSETKINENWLQSNMTEIMIFRFNYLT